ncbi:unnamed protein product [Kluyveromyces dobzhanskii CBS 2104]|uniref:WGS project CCBQ000000000 data, contig 00006 n=1 Tax=Kluyveromyces dobzhanskii CBS 2104 TaxID=1427455 RepID=A0A0A8LAF4_9SACH|nr:unnamed protein product [Kluyveromyces dobzhanskii CBS 2104]
MQSISPIPLSVASFGKFGSIVSPDEEISKLDSSQKNANQGTAIKISKVSNISNQFSENHGVKNPNCNLFRCFTKLPLQKSFKCCDSDNLSDSLHYEIKVLEKHPFSTQTFIPMGRATASGYAYLVVTALPDKAGEPDLSSLNAFLCKPNQVVTYGAGVWHAPMIVVGKEEHLDFAVIINELLDDRKPECDLQERFYDGQLALQLHY